MAELMRTMSTEDLLFMFHHLEVKTEHDKALEADIVLELDARGFKTNGESNANVSALC